MTPRALFVGKLTALAQLCGFELSDTIIVLYDKNLSLLGYANLADAIDQLIIGRRSRDPFPSIAEIKEILIPESNPELEAIEAANRIVQAIAKFGYTNPDRAKAFIGELGWRVVEREGGWAALCQRTTDDDLATFKAQWRQLAKSTSIRSKAGLDDVAPRIADPNPKQSGLVSLGTTMKALTNRKNAS